MKVLVLGSGGREHAIAWQISKSPLLEQLYAIPGNPGLAEIAECQAIKLDDFPAIADFCITQKIDLVIVGPEQPLADGIVEFLEERQIKVLGCNSYAAQLESSKAFTKEICAKRQIKTAAYQIFAAEQPALDYIAKQQKFPQVIKADGLAAGKGVIIAETLAEAQAAIKDIFAGKFGQMSKIVIEEFLTGIEASFFVLADGLDYKILSSAGDHKRIGEGDTGPNTGGMGTYSPSPYITESLVAEICRDTIEPTLAELAEQGKPFRGILFAGLMITEQQEPYLIEYNIRFGDPETQSILARLESDFLSLALAAVNGNLAEEEVRFSEQKAVTLVLSAKGYPESYEKGTKIDLGKLAHLKNLHIFHAGTALKDKQLVANGGRVLNLTAIGDNFQACLDTVYEAAELVDWSDKYYRRDIAHQITSS